MEEESKPHWFRDCSVCECEYLLPVCPHTAAKCLQGHDVDVDPSDCDCFDNRELLEYPCNCEYCLRAAGYELPPLSKGPTMLHWAAVFLVIAMIAAIFGFGGIAAAAAAIGKTLFILFIILAFVAFVVGRNNDDSCC